MTSQEQAVIDHLVAAWNEYNKMETLGEWHNIEFMTAIHQAERLILVRPTIRQLDTEQTKA